MTKNPSIIRKVSASIFLLIFCFSTVDTQRALAVSHDLIVLGAILAEDTVTAVETAATAVNTAKISTESSATALSTAASAVSEAASAALETAKLTWDTVGKDALETIGFTVGRKIVDQLTQNTISWIKGGFHGNASFAVDLEGIALETADSIAGGMVLSLRNLSVCEFSASYKDDLINSVDLSVKKRPYIYNQKATCPFKESYGFKASDFYGATSQTIAQGTGALIGTSAVTRNAFGWDKFSLALQDGGNPYGLQLVTAKEQASREAEARAAKDKKLSWSKGFTDIIDTDSCKYPPSIFVYENHPSSPDFNEALPLVTEEEALQANGELMSNPVFVKNLQSQYCKTTTPGNIVSEQLTKTLNLNMERLGMSDNLNKIFATLIDTLTQKTIRNVFGPNDRAVGNVSNSPVGARPSVVVTSPVVTNVGKTSADLTSTLTFADATTKLWFLVGGTEAVVSQSVDVSNFPANISRTPVALSGVILVQAPVPTSLAIKTFSKTMSDLLPGTTYYVAVIARVGNPKDGDVLFSEVVSFKTDKQQ